MNLQASNDIGARITGRLFQVVGERKFDLWFRTAEFDYVGGVLEIRVPNQFAADQIGSRLHSELREVMDDVIGHQVELRFVVVPSKPDRVRKSAVTETPAEPVQRSLRSSESKDLSLFTGTQDSKRLRHSMDDFVVGPSNELAYKTVTRIAEKSRCKTLSPLFVHGACGLGKTHLLQGVCKLFVARNPEARWHYTTGEQFTNDYLSALQNNRMDQFRAALRRLQLLVVDDVHFMSDKTATQQEFLLTLDAIDVRGAHVVMASDCHPKLMRQVSEGLTSRFMSGMVVQVEQPDLVTRTRIVSALARRRGLNVREGAVKAMSDRCQGSVRQIEGMVTKLAAMVSLSGNGMRSSEPIGPSLVDRVLDQTAANTLARNPVDVMQIFQCVSDVLGVPKDDMLGSSRKRQVVVARSVAIFLCREMTPLSYPELAKRLKRSNHSTLIAAAKRIEEQISKRESVDLSLTHVGQTMDELVKHLRQWIVNSARS